MLFYLFIDISKLKDRINFEDSYSIEFCNRLLEEDKVAVVPGIAFGLDDFIRISYACSKEEIQEGLSRLKVFIDKIS